MKQVACNFITGAMCVQAAYIKSSRLNLSYWSAKVLSKQNSLQDMYVYTHSSKMIRNKHDTKMIL
jgi:hypothetical protein